MDIHEGKDLVKSELRSGYRDISVAIAYVRKPLIAHAVVFRGPRCLHFNISLLHP